MGKSIYRLLDEAYNRVKDCFESFNEVSLEVAETMSALIFAIFIYCTLPIWFIPYKIAKKRKKPEPEENSKLENEPTPYNCRCVVYTSPSDERTREVTLKPNAIFQSYNSHDSEAWYKCPVCNELFSSWSVYHQSKNENGTNKYCPKCKKELSGLD